VHSGISSPNLHAVKIYEDQPEPSKIPDFLGIHYVLSLVSCIMLEYCQGRVSIQDHQKIDVLHIICAHSVYTSSGLCDHVLTFFLEDTQPSHNVCLMVKQEEFRYIKTVTPWHLTIYG
jgi:hypothetical protein